MKCNFENCEHEANENGLCDDHQHLALKIGENVANLLKEYGFEFRTHNRGREHGRNFWYVVVSHSNTPIAHMGQDLSIAIDESPEHYLAMMISFYSDYYSECGYREVANVNTDWFSAGDFNYSTSLAASAFHEFVHTALDEKADEFLSLLESEMSNFLYYNEDIRKVNDE